MSGLHRAEVGVRMCQQHTLLQTTSPQLLLMGHLWTTSKQTERERKKVKKIVKKGEKHNI